MKSASSRIAADERSSSWAAIERRYCTKKLTSTDGKT